MSRPVPHHFQDRRRPVPQQSALAVGCMQDSSWVCSAVCLLHRWSRQGLSLQYWLPLDIDGAWELVLEWRRTSAPSDERHFSTRCGWISVSSTVTQLHSDLIASQDRATPAFSQPRTRGAAVNVQSSCMACHFMMYADAR